VRGTDKSKIIRERKRELTSCTHTGRETMLEKKENITEERKSL
jgi:hypothetical protein